MTTEEVQELLLACRKLQSLVSDLTLQVESLHKELDSRTLAIHQNRVLIENHRRELTEKVQQVAERIYDLESTNGRSRRYPDVSGGGTSAGDF